MARFAGSRAPQIPNLGRSGDTPDFTPMSLSSGSVGTSAGSAQAADSWGSIRENSPDMGSIASTGEEIRAQERISNKAVEANMRSDGVTAVSNTTAAKMQKDAAMAQAAATEKAGMMSAIGGIASAGLGLFAPG